ncbi:MAG TPA: hypothetical protein PKC43_04070 [Phycisphaerales bacterium]|nr:hypothetical protein [Phycisphaerales bacterium]
METSLSGSDAVPGVWPMLYVGGRFTHMAGTPASNIAAWNGSVALPLGAGLNGTVRALAGFAAPGAEGLYAGGSFTASGDIPLTNVARWNGLSNAWSDLGPGNDLHGEVLAMAVHDDGIGPRLFVAGSFLFNSQWFESAAMAAWDGSAWTPIGGIGGFSTIRSLCVHDDGSGPALYAGGSFVVDTTSGPTQNLARWDGAAWNAVGGGVAMPSIDQGIFALVSHEEIYSAGFRLFAAGSFSSAGGVPLSNVARWDGSTWSPVAGGLGATIRALARYDDLTSGVPRLFAGGDGGVWRLGDTSWQTITVDPSPMPQIRTMTAAGLGQVPPWNALFVGGDFTALGSSDQIASWESMGRSIAVWNGASWRPVTAGLDGHVRALTLWNDGGPGGPAIYAGGTFAFSPAGLNRIGRFNPSGEGLGLGWNALGPGLTSASPVGVRVNALHGVDHDEPGGPALYAAGRFQSAGGLAAANIAKWSGSGWSPLGPGISGTGVGDIESVCVFDEGSGPMTFAGFGTTPVPGQPVPIRSIARWDGVEWSAVGGGVEGSTPTALSVVKALAVFDDGSGPALYAGGTFTKAGGVPANNIARWDGAQWHALGAGITGGSVTALHVHDDGGGPALYVGGLFSAAGGVPAASIARWKNGAWSALGSGVAGGVVAAMATWDDGQGGDAKLICGGAFTVAGGQSIRRLARWNGTSWSALPEWAEWWWIVHQVNALATWTRPDGGQSLAIGGMFIESPSHDAWFTTLHGCPPDAPSLPGDLDGDGDVDGADLGVLLGSWGACPPSRPSGCPGDLDGNGSVDGADLGLLLAGWGA